MSENPFFNIFISSRALRFIFVGVLNTIFSYILFAIMLYIGLHYALAGLLCTILGVLFNFQTTGRIVFDNENNALLFRFIGAYSITYCFSVSLVKLGTYFIENMYINAAIATIFTAILSYHICNSFVFARGDYANTRIQSR